MLLSSGVLMRQKSNDSPIEETNDFLRAKLLKYTKHSKTHII